MKELRNPDFRNQYIPHKSKRLLGVDIDEEAIEFIDRGVMNFVYKITTPKGIIYFKQALREAKYREKIGSDLASIPYLRIKYERNYIDKLQDAIPEEIQLPQILDYDVENNILILSDVAGKNGFILENILLGGNFNEKTASNIGRFLGISHRYTYNKNNIVRGSTEEDMRNWEIFLNMRTRGVAKEGTEKAVVDELSELFDDVLQNHTYDILINMDCCPKNIFQRPDGSIGVIDFELASGVGDPAYDIGFALGHYFLFSVLKGMPETSIASFKTMVSSYLRELEGLKFQGLMGRILKYGGAVMLYRVAGSSPARYIATEKKQGLIEKGSRIIITDCTGIDEVVRILRG